MKKAFKYKLTLSDKQKRILSSWSGICRFLFNAGLEHRIVCWNQHRHTVSYKEQQNALPEIKKCPEFEWMKQVPSQALQCALRNLDRAFQRFFTKNGGFPRFKKKYQDDSLHFPTPNNFQLRFLTKKTGTVFLPKIGEIKFRCHRPWEGEVRNATVTRSGDDWFISFCCEVEIKAGHHSGGIVGIDLGVTNTLSTSHGELTTIPLDKIKKIEKRIGVLQRRQTKQKKFSPRWIKQVKYVSKLHRKVTRIRHNFLHQVSKDLTKNHSLIFIEDLKIANMTKSAKGTMEEPGKNVAAKSGLNRSILRQGWGLLNIFLEYKSQWSGGYIYRVAPHYTSQTCSRCFFCDQDNRRSQEKFLCVQCGFEEHADINAAINIKRLGLESLGFTPLDAPTKTAQAV